MCPGMSPVEDVAVVHHPGAFQFGDHILDCALGGVGSQDHPVPGNALHISLTQGRLIALGGNLTPQRKRSSDRSAESAASRLSRLFRALSAEDLAGWGWATVRDSPALPAAGVRAAGAAEVDEEAGLRALFWATVTVLGLTAGAVPVRPDAGAVPFR